MYRILSSDEAARLIQSGETICVNSFVGIENPVELHEAIYRRLLPLPLFRQNIHINGHHA